jgi:hypothetical protein
MATPVDVARLEDVTTEHLGGVASQAATYELAAFQTAVLDLAPDTLRDELSAARQRRVIPPAPGSQLR